MTEGGDREEERACRFKPKQSVLESQPVKNQLFSCKISTKYEKPRQSVARIQLIKSY